MHDVPAGRVRDQGLGIGWLNGPDVTRVLKMLLNDVGILHGFSPVVRVCYGANEGERARACCTIPGRISRTYSISARMVPRPRLQRKAPCRYGPGTPMARNTCEGSSEPELQAEPVDSATPCRSRLIIRASPQPQQRQHWSYWANEAPQLPGYASQESAPECHVRGIAAAAADAPIPGACRAWQEHRPGPGRQSRSRARCRSACR